MKTRLLLVHANFNRITGGPGSLLERRRGSCLQAVLCYKRLFTKVCMGCKRLVLREKKFCFLKKSTANELHQNPNASSGEDYISQISTVLCFVSDL